MVFLTGQSWRELKSWYTGGDPDQGFWRCFADRHNQSLLSFLARIRSEKALNRTFPFTYDFKVTPLQAFFAARVEHKRNQLTVKAHQFHPLCVGVL